MRTRAQNCWQTAKNLFFDYSAHSTIHGVNYIAERNRSWCEKVWWIAAFCVSVLGCTKLIFDAWNINPIIISFTGKPTPIWQIPFPAITICPTMPTDSQDLRNMVKKFDYMGVPLNRVSDEEKQQLLALSAVCSYMIDLETRQNYTNCNECLAKLRKIRIPMEDIFFACKFKDQVINCTDHLKEVVLKSGLCYTFNGFDVYRKNNKNHEVQEWTIDEGYASTASVDAYPYRASGIGVKSGFTVTLKFNKTAIERLCDTRSGFWVEYRMPYEVPRFTTGYIAASMGHAMTIIFDPKLMTTSQELSTYTVAERNCYFSDERLLKYFEKYTQSNCETECEIDNVLKNCGCFPLFVEDRGTMETCGPYQEQCMLYHVEVVKISNYLGCNCLPACSSIAFESEVLVNDLNVTHLKRTQYINEEDYVYSQLTFYFKQNQFMTSQRNELYGKTDFLANVGGLMGLFLGVSVISLLEILYFCSIRACFNRKMGDTRRYSVKILQKTKGVLQILRDLAADYSTKTTIQGINYVANTGLSRTERCWWLFIVVFSIFICGSLISDIYKRYRDSPVIINLANEETSIFQIPFPAITVCPQVAAINTVDKYHYFNVEKHSLYDLDQDYVDTMTAVAQICDPNVFGDIDPQNKTNCETCSQKLDEMMGPIENVFYECDDANMAGSCQVIFERVITEEGVCYTYNGLNVYRQFNDTFFRRMRIDWDLENGYTINTRKMDVFPQPGSYFPLKVVLGVNKTIVDYLCKGPIQGFKLFLHLPNETPQISKHYYLLPYNYIAQIMIKIKMITTEPEIRAYPVEKRQCYFSDERFLMFYRDYTQNNCESECIANMTMKKCGCLRFHMPKLPGVKFCGISDIKCYQSVTQLNIEQNIGQQQSYECNCLPACTSITYDTEVNQFLSPEIERDISQFELMENLNFAVFSATFKHSQFVALQRSQLFGPTEFIASCGGLLGLLLGFSFMSVVELVYFCTIRLSCNLKTLLQ